MHAFALRQSRTGGFITAAQFAELQAAQAAAAATQEEEERRRLEEEAAQFKYVGAKPDPGLNWDSLNTMLFAFRKVISATLHVVVGSMADSC